MKIYIGADHKGYNLKEEIKQWLISNNHQVEDCGASELTPMDDYVDYAKNVGNKVSEEKARLAEDSSQNEVGEPRRGSRGIVICGSGAGVDITANKINGIRACLGFNIEQVKAARADDDVNVLALSSDFTIFDDAKLLIDAFLKTPFDPTDNHVRRIEKIKSLES
ncbi:MAG: Ribose 5-phosphate isomerase [Candidatus Woesebacteria bacterium GW2011_GWB1_38_5b]|uniref:Ribose 5-phosphate isomerase n=1 Tax=Candidatus Woesebacteria bacterium GW2011_GWB1_38_5b TaxID=1618569 RepID=A0A0G0K609_9BACT|nr:MAG: Ribose 5-phosphate isomerase [Candidatus Woesebacteria bacterium GW2011_GWB1_38_5b]OGH47233.1 MAG: hypothetical protein A3A51_01755 [Candidatus Levybacteria bacterium RIFCSPLOWO2_01_FULL_39_10]